MKMRGGVTQVFGVLAACMAAVSAFAEFVPADRQLDGVTLPEGYELLPFVSSTGSQYVDLGVAPDETVAYEITLRNDADQTVSQQVFGSRVGFRDHATAFSIQRTGEPNGEGWTWHSADKTHYSATFYSGFNVTSFDAQRRVLVNGQLVAQLDIGDAPVANGLNLYLFSVNNNGNPHDQFAKVSVRRFKLWKDGELVRDCVGARNSSRAIGLYDLVSGGFFASRSGTSLVAGHDFVPAERQLDGVTLPEGYALLEYVSATAKGPYVDTGICPDGTTGYEIVASLGNDDEQFLMGSRDFAAGEWAFFAALSGKTAAGGYSTLVAAQKSMIAPSGFQVWSFSPADGMQRLDGTTANDFSSISWPSGETSANSIYLFALNNAGTVHANKAVMSVRRLRIWQGADETPVLDYVPAKFGDEVGFYDLVAEEFVKPVTDSGSFTAGPEVDQGEDPEVDPGEDPEVDPEVVHDPTLSYAANGNRGAVTATVGGSVAASGAERKAGSAVVLTATPADGYEFSYWSGTLPDGASATANPLCFEMPEDPVSLRAYFASTNRVVPAGWTEPSRGVLLITFDDNAIDSWLAATNLFARYEAHASFAVIGDPSGYGADGSKLMALKACGHTVGLHTWGHVNTDGYVSNPQRYFEEQVKPQLDEFMAMGHACSYMAYPNNKHTPGIDEYIRRHSTIRHFRAGEVASESGSPYWHAAAAGKDLARNDAVFTPVAELAEMSVLNGMGCATSQYGTSVEVVKAGLGRIATNNEVMVMFSHDIQSSPSTVGMSPTMLEEILASAKALGVRVVGADEIPYVPLAEETEPEEPDEPENPGDPEEPEEPGEVTLPYGCERLQYVESTGAQYIDTGVVPNGSTAYRLEFQMLSSAGESVFLLGSRVAFKDHAFYLSHQGVGEQQGGLLADGYTFSFGDAVAYTHRHDVARMTAEFVNGRTGLLDRVAVADLSAVSTFTGSRSIYLFTVNNNGTASTAAAKMRLYSCTLTQNGQTVRSFVPVRCFGTVGLYDTIGRVFYPSMSITQGASGLVAGPELVMPESRRLPVGYTRLEYVSSSGHELFNTEIVPDDKTEMHVRLRPHDSADVHMLGSRQAFQQKGFGLSNNGGFRMAYGTEYRDSGVMHLGTMVDVSFYAGRFYVDGILSGEFSAQTFAGAGPIYVFTVNDNGSPHSQYATIDLAELQILTNGVPAREYVAAKDAQGTPGLYDFVTGTFRGCLQGSLTAGPEVEIDTEPKLEAFNERYEGGALLVSLSRVRSRLAATSITLAYGRAEAGVDLEEWEGSLVVGAFEQGESQVGLSVADLPENARYGRLFTDEGVTEPMEIFSLVGRFTSPALPPDYRPVEYIRSGAMTGGYSIDTGYVHGRDTKIECVAEVEESLQSGQGWAAPFGARFGSEWTAGGGYAFFTTDNYLFVPRYSRSGDKVVGEEGAFPYGTKVKIVTQGAKAEWFAEPSGEKLGELTTLARIDDGINTMAIFDLNDSSAPSGFNVSGSTVVMKLYSFRMIDGNRVMRDFVPCLNEYGEPGLYESLTGTFHGNMGRSGISFETDLPTTDATYVWTGAGASADWSDAGNWNCTGTGAGEVPGWMSTVVIPSGTWTINIDRSVGVNALDLSAADLELTLSSATNRRMVVNANIVLRAGSSLCLSKNVCLCGRRDEDFMADGAGCVVEVKGGSELAFNDITVGGVGSRLVVDDGCVTTTGGLAVRTTGDVSADGLWVRGRRPAVVVGNGLRADAVDAVLPVHFVVPAGGYAAAPIRSEGTGRCFSTWVNQTQAYDSAPAVVFIDPSSRVLKTRGSLDVPLVSFPDGGGRIAAETTQLSPVPQGNANRESFFYWAKQGDAYQRTSEVQQSALNLHAEGSGLAVVIY